RGKVETPESRLRIDLGEPRNNQSAATADIENFYAARQRLVQAGNQGHNVRFQRAHDALAAVFGHHVVKARKFLVGHSAALAKTLENQVLDAAELGDVLAEDRHVVRSSGTGQKRGVLGWKQVTLRFRIVFLHATCDHRP